MITFAYRLFWTFRAKQLLVAKHLGGSHVSAFRVLQTFERKSIRKDPFHLVLTYIDLDTPSISLGTHRHLTHPDSVRLTCSRSCLQPDSTGEAFMQLDPSFSFRFIYRSWLGRKTCQLGKRAACSLSRAVHFSPATHLQRLFKNRTPSTTHLYIRGISENPDPVSAGLHTSISRLIY